MRVKESPTDIFSTINKNLKKPSWRRVLSERSHKRPSSTVYNFGRLGEPILISD